MFRIDDASAATSLPVPEVAGAEGFWTEGNPVAGVAATLERASWFNMVQEELRSIAVAGGQTPSKTSYNQILLALQAMFGAGRVGHAYTANDWVPLPGGLIIQWGQFSQSDNGTPVAYSTNLPIAFPTGGLQAFLTPGNAVPNSGSGTVELISRSTITGFTNANTATRTWRFLAIGY